MTAFDSSNDAGVYIYFDDNDRFISIGTSARDEELVRDLEVDVFDVPSILSDLIDAFALRGGDVVGFLAKDLLSRNITTEKIQVEIDRIVAEALKVAEDLEGDPKDRA